MDLETRRMEIFRWIFLTVSFNCSRYLEIALSWCQIEGLWKMFALDFRDGQNMHYATLAIIQVICYAVDDKAKPVKVTQRKAAARLGGIIGWCGSTRLFLVVQLVSKTWPQEIVDNSSHYERSFDSFKEFLELNLKVR